MPIATEPRRRELRHTESIAALVAPVGLFTYGVLRFVDGLDGDHGPGWAWTVGHLFFLAAMASFALFAAAAAARMRRSLATACAAAVAVGVAAFCWVILGDLFPAFDDAVQVPDAMMTAGPLLLVIGLLPLIAMVARQTMNRWWALAPVFGLLGFVLISADLNLLVPAALAFGAALFPLALSSEPRIHRL
jgi:hypothetical protein